MEPQEIESLFEQLKKQKAYPFPQANEPLNVPSTQGVYVIRNSAGQVVHVGRTLRGRSGLNQRLKNHLRGQSSFVQSHLEGKASKLRDGYTYQYLEVPDDRKRALLECLAIASHCPEHLGVGALKPATH
jgi:excinuclease UvrABC nuclease subunit